MKLTIMLMLAASFFISCKNNTAKNKKGKEYTSLYICPMYCTGSGSDSEGECPVCKMDYVLNEDRKNEINIAPNNMNVETLPDTNVKANQLLQANPEERSIENINPDRMEAMNK